MDPRVLRLLIDRATGQRDDAAVHAAEARRAHDGANATLRTLTDYRDESLTRGPVRAGVVVGMAQLASATRFDARLVAAIHQQYREAAERREAARLRDLELIERQRQLKALQTLELRTAQQAQKLEARREQHAIDEFATGRAARRRPAKGPTT
jgi:flagellar export protein FliJ